MTQKLLLMLCIVLGTLTGCAHFQDPEDLNEHLTNERVSLRVDIPVTESDSHFKKVAASASVSIYNGDVKLLTAPLEISDVAISGLVHNIPAGINRVFILDVMDASGNVVYNGKAVADVIPGQTVSVTILISATTGSAIINGKIIDANKLTDPIVYLPLDGITDDYGIFNFEVSNKGAIPTTDRLGNSEKAFYFNNGAYLEIPYDSKLDNPNEFTLSAWAKSDVSTYQEGFIIDLGYASDNHYAISWHESNGMCGGYNNFKIGTFDVDPTQWHHYAFTYNGKEAIFYIDGVEVNRRASTPGTNMDNPLRIGEQSKALGYRFWRGAIDEVRIYNRALSQAEINTLK